jgi:hypothetical protein
VAISDDGTQVLAAAHHQVHWQDQWRPCCTLTLFGPKGQKQWSIGGLDEKTGKPAFAERCDAGVFAADGKKIVVLADKKARVLNTADGRPGVAVDAVKVSRMGNDVLLSDGEDKVTLFSPAEEKVLGQRAFGKAGPVVLEPAPGMGGVVVGTEADGTFRLVRVTAGKLEDPTAWQVETRGRILKAAAACEDLVAVSYWGGTLRIVDRGGKVRFEQNLEQDITVMEWANGWLFVGQAGGRMVAMKVP